MSKLRKCCRVCLKEIDVRNSMNLMQPPNPVVQLRDGTAAKSYLQCYYFCLQSNNSRFNIKYLTDHPYICFICMEDLIKTVNFIVKSQRNEAILKIMYEKQQNSRVRNSAGTSVSSSLANFLNDEETTEFQAEEDDIIEKCVEEQEVIEDDLQGMNIFEIERLSEVHNETEIMEEGLEKEYKIRESDLEEQLQNVEEINNTIEVLEEVVIPIRKKTQKSLPYKPAHKKSFSLNYKCLLCKKTFTFQRQLYKHYDDEHDPKVLAFPCDICLKRHISHKALAFHKHSIHNNVEYKDCEICGQVLLPAFFKAHKERHKTAVLVYACDQCNCTFGTESTLRQHHRDVHDKGKSRLNFIMTEKLYPHAINQVMHPLHSP